VTDDKFEGEFSDNGKEAVELVIAIFCGITTADAARVVPVIVADDVGMGVGVTVTPDRLIGLLTVAGEAGISVMDGAEEKALAV